MGYQYIEPILALSASSPQSYCYILPVILQKITFAKKIAPNWLFKWTKEAMKHLQVLLSQNMERAVLNGYGSGLGVGSF